MGLADPRTRESRGQEDSGNLKSPGQKSSGPEKQTQLSWNPHRSRALLRSFHQQQAPPLHHFPVGQLKGAQDLRQGQLPASDTCVRFPCPAQRANPPRPASVLPCLECDCALGTARGESGSASGPGEQSDFVSQGQAGDPAQQRPTTRTSAMWPAPTSPMWLNARFSETRVRLLLCNVDSAWPKRYAPWSLMLLFLRDK